MAKLTEVTSSIVALMKEHPVDFWLLVWGRYAWGAPETDEEAGTILLDLIQDLPHGPDKTIVLSALENDSRNGWDNCTESWADLWKNTIVTDENLPDMITEEQLAEWFAEKPYSRSIDKYWTAPGWDEEEPITNVPADYYQIYQALHMIWQKMFERQKKASEKRTENILRKQREFRKQMEKGDKLLEETRERK